MRLDRQKLLGHLTNAEERLIGARALDAADKALQLGEPVATGFLDPSGREIAQGVLGAIPSVRTRAYGGYTQAEYQILMVFPEFYLIELLDPALYAVQVSGDFPANSVNHGDFLGAILATGLQRDRVGDIILTPNGCQAVVGKQALATLTTHLRQVHRVPVLVKEIDLEQLMVTPQRVKNLSTTVASLRIDAVAAFGFGMSRTKMAREIKGGRLKLNWRVIIDPAQSVAVGDVISMRGRGRVTVDEIKGETRKGRIALALTRTI